MKNRLASYMGSEASLKASAWHEPGEAEQQNEVRFTSWPDTV